jgi:hypothetical protein
LGQDIDNNKSCAHVTISFIANKLYDEGKKPVEVAVQLSLSENISHYSSNFTRVLLSAISSNSHDTTVLGKSGLTWTFPNHVIISYLVL